MNIQSFDDLIATARAQPTPQHLLFVFTKAELPADSTPAQRARFEAGKGGTLTPLMCVEKKAADLESFTALQSEAAQFGHQWDIVFAGALGSPTHSDLAESVIQAALDRMVEAVKMGTISSFIPFDRNGQAVKLG